MGHESNSERPDFEAFAGLTESTIQFGGQVQKAVKQAGAIALAVVAVITIATLTGRLFSTANPTSGQVVGVTIAVLSITTIAVTGLALRRTRTDANAPSTEAANTANQLGGHAAGT